MVNEPEHFMGADAVVVYDMYEFASTVLGGWIMSEVYRAENAGDDELAARWRREHDASGTRGGASAR